jgi:ABC-type branched-subunit amino acid transport system ATPase component
MPLRHFFIATTKPKSFNGAGKTTTIKTIFQEYNLTRGEILCDDKPIGKSELCEIEFFPDQNNFAQLSREGLLLLQLHAIKTE